jgi:hypothetical protein
MVLVSLGCQRNHSPSSIRALARKWVACEGMSFRSISTGSMSDATALAMEDALEEAPPEDRNEGTSNTQR